MIICDVNLLVYATVPAMPQHLRSAQWLAERLADDVPLGLSHPAMFGFIRS
jgi:predicted nucleic acid-binding protein